jgi:NAD(P)-dependent dehydrogenase (short-subunit alcohol dehydrogenase family)
MRTPWTEADMPDQAGRLVIVTGATSGLGLETARALARAGASVVLAARDAGRGEAAIRDIKRGVPAAELVFARLDLASLESVRGFVAGFGARSIDLLVNNAGVMAIPRRMLTPDGFEMQFGSNFLGHFALTIGLLPSLVATPGARVVSLASLAARAGRIDFDDPQMERGYEAWRGYCQSKLACVMFAVELGRRLSARGLDVVSAAAHPGWSVTNLQSVGPSMGLNRPSFAGMAMRMVEPFIAQSAAAGARPTLMAACAAGVRNGDYFGPDGVGGLKGAPVLTTAPPAALNEANGVRLWALAERLTGTALAR